MNIDYRETEEGKRRFENKEAYELSLKYQQDMANIGIAVHNHFANECTIDFCCCEKDGNKYHTFIPSFRTFLKENLNKLYEECKHGDEEHQLWLKNKFNEYLNKNT